MDSKTAVKVPSHNSTDPADYINFARMLAAPYARRECVDIDDSEAFADACLAMTRARKTYRPDVGAKSITYAGKAIRFAIREGYRQRVRGWASSGLQLQWPSVCVQSVGYADETLPARPADSSATAVDRDESCERVQAAVEQLPVNIRRVILRLMAGEKLREIAVDLGVSRQRIQRIQMLGYSMLRDLLGDC